MHHAPAAETCELLQFDLLWLHRFGEPSRLLSNSASNNITINISFPQSAFFPSHTLSILTFTIIIQSVFRVNMSLIVYYALGNRLLDPVRICEKLTEFKGFLSKFLHVFSLVNLSEPI